MYVLFSRPGSTGCSASRARNSANCSTRNASPPPAEAEIHTIGVDPAFQGRGIGRALLHRLLAVADAAHAAVFLEVRVDNDVARTLYESEGFTVVGVRRRYYQPSGTDAHTMRRGPR